MGGCSIDMVIMGGKWTYVAGTSIHVRFSKPDIHGRTRFNGQFANLRDLQRHPLIDCLELFLNKTTPTRDMSDKGIIRVKLGLCFTAVWLSNYLSDDPEAILTMVFDGNCRGLALFAAQETAFQKMFGVRVLRSHGSHVVNCQSFDNLAQLHYRDVRTYVPDNCQIVANHQVGQAVFGP